MQTPTTSSRPLREQADVHYRTSKWERRLFTGAVECVDLQSVVAKGSQKFGAFPPFARELFARMYSPGSDRGTCEETKIKWAEEAHRIAEDLPDFDRLSKRTSGNEFASTIAATTLADAILDVMPGEQKDDPNDLREELEALDGTEPFPGKDELKTKIEEALKRSEKQGNAVAEGIGDAEGELRHAVRKACENAQAEIDSAEEAVRSFGSGSGSTGRSGNSKEKGDLAARIARSPKLKRIAELAGRFCNIAVRKQREKTDFSREEVADVEIGADISRLLPTELARLADDDLELSFLRDLVERRLMQYRMEGKDEQGRGPIVLCLDESGSMSGEREIWSKAIFLALMEVARRQKRAAALIHFCGSVSRVDVFRPGKFSPVDVLDAAEHFTGGGTSFEAPLLAAKEVIETTGGFEKADVVFVTDGSAAPVGEWWNDYRSKKKVTTYGIAIDGAVSAALTGLSDEVLSVSDIRKASNDEREVLDTLFNL